MNKVKYYVKEDNFIIENYNHSKPFSSFFPCISGLWGKPIWAFYTNRGQSISSFGTNNKDGAILEFVAANKAYRHTTLEGFRTFLKIKVKNSYTYTEPFRITQDRNIKQTMIINSYSLKLIEKDFNNAIQTTVEYFTLPNENIAGLVRILNIKNISTKNISLECIDGLPMIIPYGITNDILKNMSRLGESWFTGVTETTKNNVPCYKLDVIPADKPEIEYINKTNFYYGFTSKNKKVRIPKFIIDSDDVFGNVTDYTYPARFYNKKHIAKNPISASKNKTPAALAYFNGNLKKNKSITYTSITGNTVNLKQLNKFIDRFLSPDYIDKQLLINKTIIKDIEQDIFTNSGSKQFDYYSRQTYLDNLLRGGYPIDINNNTILHLYSRIHGDMEREYNNFQITPEYFSQGNGNYRDVTQNRRNDIFFCKEIGSEIIEHFMNLIQLDGFNPMGIIVTKFHIKNKSLFLSLFHKKYHNKISAFIGLPFTIGSIFNFLETNDIKFNISKKKLLNTIFKISDRIDSAIPKEGFWTDHWHYNTDLIEKYEAIFPEKIYDLLFNNNNFTFYDNVLTVKPRNKKYVLYKGTPMQLNAVTYDIEKEKIINKHIIKKHYVRTQYGKGKIYKTTLLPKLISIITNKFASLDYNQVGIEMEANKPNWCDALNGLPGIFGSSSAESYELKRLIKLVIEKIRTVDKDILLYEELYQFINQLNNITRKYKNNKYKFWDKTHSVKEDYRKKTYYGINGNEKIMNTKSLLNILNLFLKVLNNGLRKSFDKKSGVVNTYFENVPTKYSVITKRNRPLLSNGLKCINVTEFNQKPLPLFLEGPVHYLRLINKPVKAKTVYDNIIKSGLYDKRLRMYKINEHLTKGKERLGRIGIFTPGWLENESIWVHMEYKYILEVLRAGLVKEFYDICKTALVPYMNPDIYGRSIFENVSFIVSSAHPEKKYHGNGFVARLSGSTAEFVSMWINITSGEKPFYFKNNELSFKLDPKISKGLFTKKPEKIKFYFHGRSEKIFFPKDTFAFNFMSDILIVYHNPTHKDTFGKNKCKIIKYFLTYKNNKKIEIINGIVKEPYSKDIRNKKIKRIDIVLK